MTDASEITVCYRHPDRATRLRCSNCGRPICADCSVDAAVGQRCPECAAPQGRHRVVQVRQALRPSFATAPVSFGIISVAVGLFVIGLLSPEIETELRVRFASANWLIAEGEWWRVLTSAFLHGGLTHILFNMWALFVFGPRLEIQVGSLPFALMYAAAAAGGGAASYLFGPIDQVAVGASGAIFGLFGVWLFVAFVQRETAAGRAQFNQLFVLLLINLALPLLIPNIDWRAHVGGLVVGVLIAALWRQFAVGRPNAVAIRSVIAAAVLVGCLALVIVL